MEKAPPIQYVSRREQLSQIQFQDGLAAVELSAELLDDVPMRNDLREPSPRLTRLEQAIRDHGFRPTEPIVARIGRLGRWVILDGGHRITAAKKISKETMTNLFGPKIRTLYFLLFQGPNSYAKLKRVAADAGMAPDTLPEAPPLDAEEILADRT